MRFMIMDCSNLLYRSFYKIKDEDEDTIAGMAAHTALTTLNKYFKMFKPDHVVMAFDRPSWRKEYTASEKCISKKPYKGNRRKDMKPRDLEKYQLFMEHIASFEEMIKSHTSVITLAADRLEADDLIAGFAQTYHPNNEIVIISADSDLAQLLRYDNVRVISPATDKDHNLNDWDDDAEYYLFSKCVRGDPTDNVQSAFPNVRQTRIRKAYDDEYELVALMKEKWSGPNNTEYTVASLFRENQLLIDLEMQPSDIRSIITETITEEMKRKRRFVMFKFLQYIGKMQLTRIKERIDDYLPMLSR